MEIVKAKTADATIDLGHARPRRRRTAIGLLRVQAERRRLGANIFVVASLIGVVALAAGLALLAR
jgi:hypothetical protein